MVRISNFKKYIYTVFCKNKILLSPVLSIRNEKNMWLNYFSLIKKSETGANFQGLAVPLAEHYSQQCLNQEAIPVFK